MASSTKQKPATLSQTLLQTKPPALSPYKSITKKKTKVNPLTTLCLAIGCIVLFMYIVIFFELDGFNPCNLWTSTALSGPPHDIFNDGATNPFLTINMNPANGSTPDSSSSPPQPQQHGDDAYFSMFEHIHITPFQELSPELQTRHLHELFRYRVMSQMHHRQKNGDKKQPNQGELLVLLNNLYADHGSGVNFVQIGACDGNWEQSNDPIQKFILQNKEWHGVMLEPVPSIYETLKVNIEKSIKDWTERIVAINAALSDHDGFQTFYVVNKHFGEEMPNESHALKFQIGSFNKDHVVKHLKVKRERVWWFAFVIRFVVPILGVFGYLKECWTV